MTKTFERKWLWPENTVRRARAQLHSGILYSNKNDEVFNCMYIRGWGILKKKIHHAMYVNFLNFLIQNKKNTSVPVKQYIWEIEKQQGTIRPNIHNTGSLCTGDGEIEIYIHKTTGSSKVNMSGNRAREMACCSGKGPEFSSYHPQLAPHNRL